MRHGSWFGWFFSANHAAGTPGTTDLDILFGAAQSTFQSSGLQIRNFTQGFDQVRVGATTLKTQSEINTFFGDSGQSINLV